MVTGSNCWGMDKISKHLACARRSSKHHTRVNHLSLNSGLPLNADDGGFRDQARRVLALVRGGRNLGGLRWPVRGLEGRVQTEGWEKWGE